MTENPAIKRIRAIQENSELMDFSAEKASYKGVVQKEALLLALTVASAFAAIATAHIMLSAMLISCFLALFIALAIAFRPQWAGVLSPLYVFLKVRRSVECRLLWK